MNLVLAAGSLLAPVLALPSTLVLGGASIPVIRRAVEGLREGRADRNAALAFPAVLALISGDRLPAAIMLWMFRRWDMLTARALRQAERVVFERLSSTAAHDARTVRSAGHASSRYFVGVARDRAARTFADSSAPLMLGLGAAALASGGPALAQAAMRPDFFSSVMVQRRMVGADVAMRLSRIGCVVRSFESLLAAAAADQVVLDDSVEWDADVDFGSAVAQLRFRETVYFHSPANAPGAALMSALGRPRLIARSMARTPAAYLSQQRLLGHRVLHARAVGSGARLASTDLPIAVGENCLELDQDAPIGLMRPSLDQLLTILRTVRVAAAENRSVELASNALNVAMVGGAIFAGFSTLGIVAAGSVATGGVWAGTRLRMRETRRAGLTAG
jgi:hypothetical protein